MNSQLLGGVILTKFMLKNNARTFLEKLGGEKLVRNST